MRCPPVGGGRLRPGWDGAMGAASGGGVGSGLAGGLPGGGRRRRFYGCAWLVRGLRPGSGLRPRSGRFGYVRKGPGARASGRDDLRCPPVGGGRLCPGWSGAMTAGVGGGADFGLAGGLPGGSHWWWFASGALWVREFCPGSGLRLRSEGWGARASGRDDLRRLPAGGGRLRPGWDGAIRGAPGGVGTSFGLVGGFPGGGRRRRFDGCPKRAAGGGR